MKKEELKEVKHKIKNSLAAIKLCIITLEDERFQNSSDFKELMAKLGKAMLEEVESIKNELDKI